MGSAERLLSLASGRSPTLGAGRLVCLDGRAGSGKTTLAAQLASLASATVIHLDELYEGWDGLPTVHEQLDTLLPPLADGRPGHYRRYDWHARTYQETVEVSPTPLLVLEGVGSYCAAYDPLYTLMVWLELPEHIRRHRALTRDGETFAPHWERWALAEEKLFAREGTRERADLVWRRT